ncbi:MAG: DUF58 domain-containing protein [Bdellovibrionota bacterium]
MWWKFRKRTDEKSESSSVEDSEIRNAGRAPLSEVAKQVKHVELVTKKKSSALLAGDYKSRFKGQGMQYSDSRIYQYGDDIRHIDWRTSARMQGTYVKTFEEERELNIIFAVDVSASNGFGSTGTSKRDSLALALACVGFSAIANNDRVGLVLFSDRVERFVPAKKGKKHILRLIDELLTFEPVSRKSRLDSALNFLISTLKNGSVLLLASDFFTDMDKRKLELLARKHDFICLRATDPRDFELPNVGLLRIEDPETGESILLPTLSGRVRQEYSKSQRQYSEAVARLLRRSGVSLLDLPTDSEPAKLLHQFFRSRRGPRR